MRYTAFSESVRQGPTNITDLQTCKELHGAVSVFRVPAIGSITAVQQPCISDPRNEAYVVVPFDCHTALYLSDNRTVGIVSSPMHR